MAFNASVILSAASEKHLGSFAVDFASQVLSAASEKYGFSLEEARSEFLADAPKVSRPVKKTAGAKAPKKEKKVKPACILPFCGQKMEDACCGIRLNHGLFTQCTNAPEGGDFCKTCQTQSDKNGGKPTYGTIADRLAVGQLDYEVNGKKVVRYSKVMDKLKITKADAIQAAALAGVEIAEEQFEVVVARKGRPPKTETSVSDTDSATSSKKSAKNGPGRPKKNAKVVKSETSDDLIAALVAEAEPAVAVVEETKEPVQTDSKGPSKTEITKANLASLKEMCSAAGLSEGKKGEMQSALRSHFGYDSDSDSSKKEKKPVQKPVQKPVKKPVKKPVQKPVEELVEEPVEEPVEELVQEPVEEPVQEPVQEEKEEPAHEEPVSELTAEESEEEEEEGLAVTPFKLDGKQYYRDAENTLYNPVSQEPVGRYNPETQKLEELPEESDDEEED